MSQRTNHADPLTGRLERITNRTVTQKPLCESGAPLLERRVNVDDSGGQHRNRSMDFALTAARTETVIGFRQCGDLGLDNGDLEIRQLVRHPVDKFKSRQAVSKSRNIVTARNQRSPTPG